MGKMTEDEWQTLHEGFDTTSLLSAVDQLDKVRGQLASGATREPPEIRTDLLRLHQLAMSVVNNGAVEQARELFQLADDLEGQVFAMVESLESIQQTLNTLTDLFPESLLNDADDDAPETKAAQQRPAIRFSKVAPISLVKGFWGFFGGLLASQACSRAH